MERLFDFDQRLPPGGPVVNPTGLGASGRRSKGLAAVNRSLFKIEYGICRSKLANFWKNFQPRLERLLEPAFSDARTSGVGAI